jgi:DNA-binding MltR family transcriptional regulator
MAYLIFNKDSNNIEGSLYRIAENDTDLNNLNCNLNLYKIITIDQQTFNDIKFNKKIPLKYNNEEVTYFNDTYIPKHLNKESLKNYIDRINVTINNYLLSNQNHINYTKWKNYLNQLNQLNLDNITYPLNISLEEYFSNNNQISLNTLQLP